MERLGRLIGELPQERLERVFTHPHWADDRASSYERLEFLGDSVLELAVARTLFDGHPEFSEGQMTKIRAHVVSRASCARVARTLRLEERLLARGAELSGEDSETLAENDKILAAVLEAALGALFLEHGFTAIEEPVVEAFSAEIQFALTSSFDAKTELQEALARAGRRAVYSVLETEGPAHDRRFTCAVSVDGEALGVGRGRSKKEAEQQAAQEALQRLAAPPG